MIKAFGANDMIKAFDANDMIKAFGANDMIKAFGANDAIVRHAFNLPATYVELSFQSHGALQCPNFSVPQQLPSRWSHRSLSRRSNRRPPPTRSPAPSASR
jgi:hypothetical protein